jgi:hypothetical protein
VTKLLCLEPILDLYPDMKLNPPHARLVSQHLDLGRAVVRPNQPVQAGSLVTLTYAFTVGHPIDDTGSIKIAFRFAGDFGVPQFTDPTAPDYCRVSTTGSCRIEPRWDPKGHTRPWDRTIYLKVMGGYLDRGDEVTVVFGDRTAGSPGWRMQTFCERSFEFKTLVDPIATFEFKELPRSPALRIIPAAPARALCIAPSAVQAGTSFVCRLKTEDSWGNPTRRPARIVCSAPPEGKVVRIDAIDGRTGLRAQSNPVQVREVPAEFSPFWADFHGQSEETIGTNTIDDYFRFARDLACVDMAGHQGNDFQITDEFWKRIDVTSARFNVPRRFVTFPGYEWSGNTPLGGDRNVYFESEGGRIVHSCTDLLPGKVTRYGLAQDADILFRELQRQKGPRAFGFAHVGGRYADMRRHDPAVEVAVEIHSAWGTFEWLLHDALRRGLRVGVCANSDDHKGRPGASYPGAGKFGSLGGLTCVQARELSRPAVLEALRARRFYATTGHRPLIDMRVVTGDRRAMMGEVIRTSAESLGVEATVHGTAALERIEVWNGVRPVRTVRPYRAVDLGHRVKVTWQGAEVRGRDRMARWDGSLELSGNSLLGHEAVNFRNPANPLVRRSPRRLEWKSVTTGGASGVILTLAHRTLGTLRVETAQGDACLSLADLGLASRKWRLGGIGKAIEVVRLPAEPCPVECAFNLPRISVTRGDNPLYLKVVQEDGHVAWTSPVYVVGEAGQVPKSCGHHQDDGAGHGAA